MTQAIITYIFVVIIGFLAIFSFVIGIEKMIKVILWNYILSSICLAASQSIVILIARLTQTPDLTFMGMSYKTIASFFTNGSTTIILILYVILLVLIYKKSKIRIIVPMDEASKKMLQIILVPLTVISMVLTLQIALMGINVTNIVSIQNLATIISTNPYIVKFISLTPVWILLHGIVTIIITSEFKISIKTDEISSFPTKL